MSRISMSKLENQVRQIRRELHDRDPHALRRPIEDTTLANIGRHALGDVEQPPEGDYAKINPERGGDTE